MGTKQRLKYTRVFWVHRKILGEKISYRNPTRYYVGVLWIDPLMSLDFARKRSKDYNWDRISNSRSESVYLAA